MDLIIQVFSYIQGLGATVMMPIIIFLLGVILKTGIGKSIRAGLMVGVGFIGLNLVIGLMANNLGPATQQMVAKYGLSLSIIDVGWPASAAIAFASVIGTAIIPICLLVNFVMLLTNTTQTLDVDVWNYWHFAFTGALVAILTNSQILGIIAAICNMIITMVIADYTAPTLEKTNGLSGISIPHGFSAAFVPVAWLVNKVIDAIPVLRDVDIDMQVMQRKFGVFGEPILVGTILGLVIGALAGYDVGQTLLVGVTLGGVLVLIPKMAAMLMEGILPISEAATAVIERKFQNRGKIYIGLDSAIGIGHPVTLSVSLILVPLTIFLAVVIPGNKVLPFADLAVIPFMMVLIIPMVGGNAFRALITGIIVIAVGLLIATYLAPLITQAAFNAGFSIPAGATEISSICDGANPLTFLIVNATNFSGYVGIGALLVFSLGLALMNRRRILKEAAEIHEAE